MVEASGAFDGWGSSLVGGLLSAVFVVIGVVLAQKLADRRIAASARKAAAAKLMVLVSDLRDNACSHRYGFVGNYKMFELRNQLFVAHVILSHYPSYTEVREFYRIVFHWRWWTRERADGGTPVEAAHPAVEEFVRQLRSYGHYVIRVLQDELENGTITLRPPTLISLPGLDYGMDDIDGGPSSHLPMPRGRQG